ncbi:MAG: APC family permease [Actinomycetota bacterium]|nr:APC family permease [Actinomycetota bacterium]
MGLASTAPVFSLAATIGFVAAIAGVKAPACMLIAFIPMLFTAYAYRELNAVIPDCGTTFTWATKAFGPHAGWMGGWAVAVTGIVFLGNAAEVTGQYLFQILGLTELVDNQFAVASVGVVFILVMAYIAYRGINLAAWTQMVLVALQYLALALLAVAAFGAVYLTKSNPESLMPELSWFNPVGMQLGDFIEATLLCLFIYWGWDAILAINEETKDPKRTPGRAALIATVILLVGYLSVTTAMIAYAGLGDTGTGLNNPAIQNDVFNAIALPLIGPWGTQFILIVTLLSAAASAQTTILPTARGTLAMATYRALPQQFARVHPKYMTPGFSTFVTCAIGLSYYVVMSIISDSVLQDTILSVSLAIAFYYALTGFSCVWYFRHEIFSSSKAFTVKFLLPLLGALMLAFAFIASSIQMFSPDYTGTDFWGIGSVFIIGFGSLAFGVLVMLAWQLRQPEFFRGETLRKDTPVLAPD